MGKQYVTIRKGRNHRTGGNSRIRQLAKIRNDPTRTTVLRERYRKDAVKRFRKLSTSIRRGVGDNDALALQKGGRAFVELPPRFNFPTSAEKHKAFMQWLEEMINTDILEVVEWEGGRPAARVEWQNKYVKSAYARGVEQADVQLRKIGITVPQSPIAVTLSLPVHADNLAALYTRNFEELRGITSAMSQQISRVLAEGLAQGLNARDIAKLMTGRVRAIGINRATVLARTEIIRVHAESSLTRYEQLGISEVSGFVEFSSSNIGVCPICEELEGKRFTIAEARGIIPVHPNCRCTWIPMAG